MSVSVLLCKFKSSSLLLSVTSTPDTLTPDPVTLYLPTPQLIDVFFFSVRYFSSPSSTHERYLLVPIQLSISPIPAVFLNPSSFEILQFQPFDERSIATAMIHHSGYSAALTQKLRCLYKQSCNSRLTDTPQLALKQTPKIGTFEVECPCSTFSHPMALLSLEVVNQSNLAAECYGDEDVGIPSIRINPQTVVR